MISIIFMAGGNARRFSGNKLMADVSGQPLFSYGLAALQPLLEKKLASQLVVVSQYPELLAEACRRFPGIVPVYAASCSQGASWTIKAGLQKAEENDGYLFCAADQPLLDPEDLLSLAGHFASSPDQIWGLGEKGILKNPVIFPSWMKEELLTLQEDEGGKKAALRHTAQIRILEADSRSFLDADTRKDLERIRDAVKNDGLPRI